MMVLLPDVHDDDEDNDGDDNDDDDGFLHKTKKNTNCPLVNPQISTHFSQFATGFCAHFRIFPSLSHSLSVFLANVYLSHFPHIAILHGLSLINC